MKVKNLGIGIFLFFIQLLFWQQNAEMIDYKEEILSFTKENRADIESKLNADIKKNIRKYLASSIKQTDRSVNNHHPFAVLSQYDCVEKEENEEEFNINIAFITVKATPDFTIPCPQVAEALSRPKIYTNPCFRKQRINHLNCTWLI